jgi:hypothetical protein
MNQRAAAQIWVFVAHAGIESSPLPFACALARSARVDERLVATVDPGGTAAWRDRSYAISVRVDLESSCGGHVGFWCAQPRHREPTPPNGTSIVMAPAVLNSGAIHG